MRHTLMVDPTVSRVILPMDLVSLLLDLVMMDTMDLAMIILNWEVCIKIMWYARGRNCSEQSSRVSKVLRRVQLKSLECRLWNRGAESSGA